MGSALRHAGAVTIADDDDPDAHADGAESEDSDDYPLGICVGKAAIDIGRQIYEGEGFKYEMWPPHLIETLGVDPMLTFYDGSSHADGQPSYGMGQISNGKRMKLLVCLPAVGDAISGPMARHNGGPATRRDGIGGGRG